MQSKKATLIINPRSGENVAQITDVLAILAAAGWKTNIVLKEYGGHTLELAQQASKDSSELLIAYGGDGTLNQAVNGAMTTSKARSTIAVLPGGTANVWAGEIGIPNNPVKAALSLINSEMRKVDVGHIEIQKLTYPDGNTKQLVATNNKKSRKKKKPQGSKKARHHFLLMAGLGIDAAIMQHVSKPLKYRIGPLAVGLSAAKELPAHHAFPVEIRSAGGSRKGEVLWQGEALQIVVGNTRRYADIAEMTPEAYIDDGVLDVCVITGGNPLSTMQQLASLLLRRKPDNLSAEYFHGTHLEITVPASVPLQLDGSAVKLKDYLNRTEYATLQQSGEMGATMLTYRFDAMPHALGVAIPRTYNDELFEHTNGHNQAEKREYVTANVGGHNHNKAVSQTDVQKHTTAVETLPEHEQHSQQGEVEKKDLPESVQTLLEHGRRVTVVGKAPLAEKKATYIIAGNTPKPATGERRPVAIIVDEQTPVYSQQGDELPAPQAVENLQEETEIVVEGKKNKRGVIVATRMIIP